MNINRAVVKQQAQNIIKGNILKLFFISLIIGILAGGSISYNASDVSDIKEYFEKDRNPFSDKYDEDENANPFDFDDFTKPYDENFFDEFDGNGMITLNGAVGIFAGAMAIVALLMVAKGLFLGPLKIMLDGLYWELIKGNNMEFSDGLGFVFKKTFDKNYWNKFFLNLLQSIFLGLLYLCFIIPGVIYTYKWYFTSYLMAEKPELSFEEAMKLSDKMTKGHKWELFVMDLSFLGWYLLLIPTIGFVSIYVTPYVSTTKALYYENFKIRAYQEGAITQYDFMTAKEKVYANQIPMQAPDCFRYAHSLPEEAYHQQPQATVQDSLYQPSPMTPAPQENTYYQPTAPVQENTYYQPTPPAEPVQPAAPEAPAQTEYYTPTEPPQSNNI